MKLGQLIEYNKGNVFLQKVCRKWGWEIGSRPLFIFWINLNFFLVNMRYQQVVCGLASMHFDSSQLKIQKKNKLYKTLGYWSRHMLNFNFPEKSLGLVSLPHFLYEFSRNLFLMLFPINWPNYKLSDWLYFSCWTICVFRLFVSQIVVS